MARVSSKDPLDKFRWSVEIEGFTRLGFAVCGTPSITYNTKSYAEGGAHLFPRKIIDSVEYKPVTLERGVTADQSFESWAKQAMEVHRGRSQENTAIIQGSSIKTSFTPATGSDVPLEDQVPLEYRRDVIIKHLDRTGRVVKTYILYNAIPIEFKPASDFQSDGDDLLSMEKLVLEYESFEVISSKLDTNPFDVRDSFKRLTRRLVK
jgi:phage tail-like protein